MIAWEWVGRTEEWEAGEGRLWVPLLPLLGKFLLIVSLLGENTHLKLFFITYCFVDILSLLHFFAPLTSGGASDVCTPPAGMTPGHLPCSLFPSPSVLDEITWKVPAREGRDSISLGPRITAWSRAHGPLLQMDFIGAS